MLSNAGRESRVIFVGRGNGEIVGMREVFV